MMRSIKKKRSGQSGFTLVELLVVIVILGVLAAIVVFAVGGINDKGQTSACKADKSSLETAEEAYFFASLPTAAHYTSEANLVTAGFLHEESTLHSIALGAGDASYTVSACTA